MKINIAELLKDCPKGMELDCAMYDNCTFDGIDDVGYIEILVKTPSGRISLTKEGCFTHHDKYAKCVIFPKGKTTWEGFVPPIEFKDGDIVATTDGSWIGITEGGKNHSFIPMYCVIKRSGKFEAYFDKKKWYFNRFATEEERQKLFQAIKANGYKWNAETKNLEKLGKPKFKVGNKVKRKDVNYTHIVTIAEIDGEYYGCVNEDGQYSNIFIEGQDEWELLPNKFNITTLKAFESRVLVRDYINQVWIPTFWGKRLEDDSNCSYLTTNGCYKYCIPYEGNEHLLGTTNDCDPFFKTWEK